MTDIVERLRRIARGYEPTDMGVSVNMDEAADAIEALTVANAQLREALEAILEALRIHAPGTPLNNHRFDALGIKAYAALARKP